MIAFNYIAFLTWLLIVTTISAFLVTLLHKWGVTEYVQIHGNDFFAKMFSCDFLFKLVGGYRDNAFYSADNPAH